VLKVPLGTVINELLVCACVERPRELYTWNKATSCVHNLLGGQRWIDHYGEVIITNHTLDIVCKLTFVKVGPNSVAAVFLFCFVKPCRLSEKI